MIMFGRYGLKLEFEDGQIGFFMGTDDYNKNVIFVTNDWDVANKYLSQSAVENAFEKVSGGHNIDGYKIVAAWVSKDKETIGSKIRRHW